MKLLCCNVRTSLAKDGDNDWQYRKDFCAEVIRAQNADLIGFQEVTDVQRDDLHAALPGYEIHGLTDQPTGSRQVNAIFYRQGGFRLLAAGGYWLSETPHVPASSSWDSKCIRLANWVKLIELSSGKEFRFVNTHLDHVSQLARERQARLVIEDAAGYPHDYPQILMGDMNCDSRNPAIQAFFEAGWKDTYEMTHGVLEPGITYHAFIGPEHVSPTGKIDWILIRGDLKVGNAEILKDSQNGRFPSDHYFVNAEIAL